MSQSVGVIAKIGKKRVSGKEQWLTMVLAISTPPPAGTQLRQYGPTRLSDCKRGRPFARNGGFPGRICTRKRVQGSFSANASKMHKWVHPFFGAGEVFPCGPAPTVVEGDDGATATCIFQRLVWVGNGLDGELAQLVPLSRAQLALRQTPSSLRARPFPPARAR